MGNIFSQKDEKNESIINLSDKCVSRITKEDKVCARSKPNKLKDQEWVKKLKCMDDIHSQENGLTYQCVLDLIKLLEAQISDFRPPVCSDEAASTGEKRGKHSYDEILQLPPLGNLIACLKKNEKCMIRCKRYIDDFIDCVDAHRINVIKEKYETENDIKKS